MISLALFGILVANIDTCDKDTAKEWKVGIQNDKYGSMAENLIAEVYLRKRRVTMLEAFHIAKDGVCKAKRPGNEEKNKKWKLEPAMQGYIFQKT